MESITKAGRSVGSGVYRVAGAFARGARRVLSYVPLLGVAAVPTEVEEAESSAVRHGKRLLFFAYLFNPRRVLILPYKEKEVGTASRN